MQPRKNTEIEQKIAEVYHENNGNYGYRRITLMLRKIWAINHKKVQAIIQKLGLKGKCKRRKYRSYQGEVGKIADNLLGRNFQATKPNEKWATDVTEFKCAEGKLYLGKRFESITELKQTIHDYIYYYNNERIQVKLKGLSPVEYRTQSLN